MAPKLSFAAPKKAAPPVPRGKAKGLGRGAPVVPAASTVATRPVAPKARGVRRTRDAQPVSLTAIAVHESLLGMPRTPELSRSARVSKDLSDKEKEEKPWWAKLFFGAK